MAGQLSIHSLEKKNETRETAQGIQQEMRFSIVSSQDNWAIMLDDVRNHLHPR